MGVTKKEVRDVQDEKILLGIQNREEDVMAKVINRYSRLLWPIAAAVLDHVGDSRDVEECVADAFIYLWTNPQKFDPSRGSLKTLLCIVTRSRAIDRCRELSRRKTIPLEEVVLGSCVGLQENLLRRENSREPGCGGKRPGRARPGDSHPPVLLRPEAPADCPGAGHDGQAGGQQPVPQQTPSAGNAVRRIRRDDHGKIQQAQQAEYPLDF